MPISAADGLVKAGYLEPAVLESESDFKYYRCNVTEAGMVWWVAKQLDEETTPPTHDELLPEVFEVAAGEEFQINAAFSGKCILLWIRDGMAKFVRVWVHFPHTFYTCILTDKGAEYMRTHLAPAEW